MLSLVPVPGQSHHVSGPRIIERHTSGGPCSSTAEKIRPWHNNSKSHGPTSDTGVQCVSSKDGGELRVSKTPTSCLNREGTVQHLKLHHSLLYGRRRTRDSAEHSRLMGSRSPENNVLGIE